MPSRFGMTLRTDSSTSATTANDAVASASKMSASPPLETRSRDRSRVSEKYGRFNFCVIALYQVVMRTGWIFKTESVIMPAVLDSLGGSGWLRGLLPPLNRFGQSIPPLPGGPQDQEPAAKKVCDHRLRICDGNLFFGPRTAVADQWSWLRR